MFSPLTSKLIRLSLLEDLAFGDITSDSLFSAETIASAGIVMRQPAIVSGIQVAQEIFHQVDADVQCEVLVQNGDAVVAGTPLLRLNGSVKSILKGERLALNFLQHLSGIATLTYQFVGAVSGTGAQITHTRKTVPGLRDLEIQAVLHGGGSPHRKSLSHAVLLKDNHIRAHQNIQSAVNKIRQSAGHTTRIEVECDTLDQVKESLEAGVDLVLLDNMDLPTLQEAVKLCTGKAITEASGGVTLSNVLEIARTGVNIISTSKITLGASAVDIGLDFQ